MLNMEKIQSDSMEPHFGMNLLKTQTFVGQVQTLIG